MAIAWPKVITDKGGVRNQFAHVIDILPTVLEVSNIRQPSVVDGIPQSPIEGVSLAYTFDAVNAGRSLASPHPVFRDDGQLCPLSRRLVAGGQGAASVLGDDGSGNRRSRERRNGNSTT